jgi:flagellin-like protein
MKGISAIIATILLLLITIALALTAYLFTGRLVDNQEPDQDELKVDLFCTKLCNQLGFNGRYDYFDYDFDEACVCHVDICEKFVEYEGKKYGVECRSERMEIKIDLEEIWNERGS